MQRFRNILVYPVNLHMMDPALSRATDLAMRTGAHLTIVSLLAPQGRWFERRRRARHVRLRELTDRLRVGGVDARGTILVGKKPATLLVEHVRAQQIDLVVKTARPSDDPEAHVFSRVAKELLRTSPCPVWIVRGPSDDSARIFLAAVAPRHYEPELEQKDRDVLDVAAQLAAACGAELHVVSAWMPVGAAFGRSRVSGPEFDEYLRSSNIEARQALREFLAPHAIPEQNVHFGHGATGDVIASVTESIGAELVVIGATGRTGIRRWILGNTVEAVLDDSVTAVLGVRGADNSEGAPA